MKISAGFVSSKSRRSGLINIIALVVIVGAGIAVRMISLTDPPLDTHAFRQLRSASIARAMYYNMLPSASQETRIKANYLGSIFEKLEPQIFERLAAVTYLVVGGEYLWIPRVYAIIFWFIGGFFLFDLVRRAVSTEGALVSLGYYLLLPYAVAESRTFMPNVLMIMWMLVGIWAAYRWTEEQNWKWAVLGGLFSGVAILVKVYAIYPLGLAVLLLTFSTFGFKRTVLNRQAWVVFALMIVIPASYYLIFPFIGAAGYFSTWMIPFIGMLVDIHFYIGWLHKIGGFFSFPLIFLGMMSLPLLERRARMMVAGLWSGYFVLGLTVPSLIRSHGYYSMPLIFTIAFSLAPLGGFLLQKVRQRAIGWQMVFIAASLIGIADSAILVRKLIRPADFSQEPAFWQELSENLPNMECVGLTDDYNGRIHYFGWRRIGYYPYSFDQEMGLMIGHDFDVTAENWDYFLTNTEGYGCFVITLFDEFDAQPYLRTILYDHYPIRMEGERYVVFDLLHPYEPVPPP